MRAIGDCIFGLGRPYRVVFAVLNEFHGLQFRSRRRIHFLPLSDYRNDGIINFLQWLFSEGASHEGEVDAGFHFDGFGHWVFHLKAIFES